MSNKQQTPTTWREAFKGPFYYDEMGQVIMCESGMFLDVRGWGHLTGIGALNLPDNIAIQIQDRMGKDVVDLLNASPELLKQNASLTEQVEDLKKRGLEIAQKAEGLQDEINASFEQIQQFLEEVERLKNDNSLLILGNAELREELEKHNGSNLVQQLRDMTVERKELKDRVNEMQVQCDEYCELHAHSKSQESELSALREELSKEKEYSKERDEEIEKNLTELSALREELRIANIKQIGAEKTIEQLREELRMSDSALKLHNETYLTDMGELGNKYEFERESKAVLVEALKSADEVIENCICDQHTIGLSSIQEKIRAALSQSETKEACEWIRTEDKLPANNEIVLVLQRNWPKLMREQSYSLFSDQDETWFMANFSHWRKSLARPIASQSEGATTKE